MILLRFIGLLGLMLAGAIWIAGCVAQSHKQTRTPPCELSPEGTCIDTSLPQMVPCNQIDDDTARWVRQPANCMQRDQ